MLLQPFCKINIGLDILRRREDSFHDIDTLMVPVHGLHDTLEIERTEGAGIRFDTVGLEVDCAADRNLVVRAWMLMRQRYGIGGTRITLRKSIPFGAGLGGGSADAAFTVRGVNELFGLGLGVAEMRAIASELGSDVPFFITDAPMFCRGRGEIIVPSDIDLSGLWCVVTKPPFGIPTAEAYSLVMPHKPSVPLERRIAEPIEKWQTTIVNDFEWPLMDKYPTLRNIKNNLIRCGAVYASLSGSGSALYGLFTEKPDYKPILKDETVSVSVL